jgi:pantothenate kinase
MPSWTSRLEALLARQDRVVFGICGPPGSGKSTLAEAVVADVDGAVYLPMDGFHLADAELARLGRLDRKGAIDTFDAYGYLALLQRVRAREHTVYAPAFDRQIEQPVAASIPVPPAARLVVTEGNYLLDDDDPWPAISAHLDEVWFLDVAAEERHRRLLARHIEFGKSPADAEAWVRAVDEPNAERIQAVRTKADAIIDNR